ncbi:MAG: hypothetical protein NC299_17665 [Lachnospiraceae bacterium]|nr:hypothetical protein [Lachnospiraceae bacterium]
MKRQIRQCVFETNSSSTHSICISKKPVTEKDIPSFVAFNHGEFGWEIEKYDGISDRASYLYQAICELCCYDNWAKSRYVNSLHSTLSKYGVECEFDFNDKDEDGWAIGYIDHGDATRDFVASVMRDEDKLIRYLFGDSVVITGNDNAYDEECISIPDSKDYEIFYKGN